MTLEEIERGLDIHLKVYPRETTKFIEKQMRKLILFAHRIKDPYSRKELISRDIEYALKELEEDDCFVKPKL